MFLIFQLGRLDVWPVGDLAVRKGYSTAWGLAEPPTPKELTACGEAFRPYRSVAAWYCWRATDTVVPDSSNDSPPLPETSAAKKATAKKATVKKATAKGTGSKRTAAKRS
jgi:DNA-3-methyladenine glycosylase II